MPILLRTTRLVSLAAMVLAGVPAGARAQTVEELQRQIDELKAAIDALKAEQEKDKAGPRQPVEPLEVAAKGAPRFSGEGFRNFKLRGRVQTDIGQVGDPDEIGTLSGGAFSGDSGLGTTSEVRRARLGVEGEIEDWQYKFEADFADDEVEVTDAFVAYKGLDLLTITLGNQKTAVSLDEETSSRFTAFTERAAFTDAFNFKRETGVSASIGGETWHWETGAYSSGGLSGDDEEKGYILASRAHYTLPFSDGFVHLGASAEFRDEGAQETRFRQRPFLHTTDTRFVDTGTLATASSLFYGAELAGDYGPFNLAAEYGALSADLLGAGHADFDGGYVNLGYFLTGERRGYSAEEGIWERTKPSKELGKGGFGALELNLGYDRISLNDRRAGVRGGDQATYNVGLTWIPISYVRLVANYAHIDVDDSPTLVERNGDGSFDNDFGVNAFGLRAQVDW